MGIFQNFWNLMTTPNERVIRLIGLPCTIIEAYVCMKLFTTILDIQVTKKQEFTYVLIFSTISLIFQLFLPQSIASSLNMIVWAIAVFLILKAGFIRSILAEAITVVFSYSIELLAANCLHLLTNMSYEQLSIIPIYRIICITLVYTTLFLLYLLFKKKGWKIKISDSLHTNKKFIFILNFSFALISLGIQIYIFICYSNILSISLLSINMVTLILYFIISVYNIYNTNKLAVASANLEEAQLYNKTLSILHDNIRAFKHDFNNIIHAIGGYVQTNDMDGLKKYYSQLQSDCMKNNNLTALSPHVINNPAVYNILATKYYLADEVGIDINLEVFFDLNDLNMKIYEFTRILGILMDNAIEATRECENKKINLIMRRDINVNRQLLIIENTYKDKTIDTEKIFEKGYSTKENNSGLGLWEIRQILKKNRNLNLYTTKNNEYFIQQLEIYDK